MTNKTQSIPDQSQPGLTMTTPSAPHQDTRDKYNTGDQTSKIRGRDNITIGTWNVRTLRPAGKPKRTHMRWTGTTGTSLDSANYDGITSAKQQLKRDTSCTIVVKRTSMDTALVFLLTKISQDLPWDVTHVQQTNFHLPKARSI